jgi:hypothetical protein
LRLQSLRDEMRRADSELRRAQAEMRALVEGTKLTVRPWVASWGAQARKQMESERVCVKVNKCMRT